MTAQTTHRAMNIVLAVDGSEHSMAAVNLLCDLPIYRAESPHSLVTILAVDDLRHSHPPSALTAILEKTQEILARHAIRAQTSLLRGDPASELTRYADEHPTDLIVLGARGLRATLGILLGGVAQQVVEYASCPVLVVRAPYQGLRRVLFVTDGSQHSKLALEFLLRFPLPESAELFVAHVLPPPPHIVPVSHYWPIYAETIPIPTDEDSTIMTAWQAEQEANGKALLEQATAELVAGGLHAQAVLLRGDAATEIIGHIRANAVDLFIAGSRGLSQVQAWLLGSVSRKLIHYANCSGLIVKQLPHPI